MSEINILKDNLVNYILINNDKYISDGFEIWIHEKSLRIKYSHKIYNLKVMIENNLSYWFLEPYNNSYFKTEIKEYSSFESIIYAIKDDWNFSNTKNQG